MDAIGTFTALIYKCPRKQADKVQSSLFPCLLVSFFYLFTYPPRPKTCYHNSVDSNRKRLLYYLLLNVLVSVCATASVLFIYDRYFRNPVPQVQESQSIQTSSAALEPAKMEITTVIGAGLPSSEMVVLRNAGQMQVKLSGWKLHDEDSNVYTFGELTLPPGGAAQLHTAPGKDTLIDLYWSLTAPAWRSGETATLLDTTGNVRSVYKVP